MPWLDANSNQTSQVDDAVWDLLQNASTRFGPRAPHVCHDTDESGGKEHSQSAVTATLDSALFSSGRHQPTPGTAASGLPGTPPHGHGGALPAACMRPASAQGRHDTHATESRQPIERAGSDELQRYIGLAAAPSSYTIAFSPLRWWGSAGAQRFPLLHAAARCVLAIPVSSIRPSMCFDSTLRAAEAQRRRRVSGDTSARSLFLSENLRELYGWVERVNTPHATRGTSGACAWPAASP